MGKRGTPLMPTKLKVLHGEKREERLNRDAPKPKGGSPAMPKGMTRRAQAIWRRQMKAIGDTGILTVADTDSLRAYCEAADRYIEASELLAQSTPLVEGAKQIIRNPLHQIVRDNATLVRMFAKDLGFLPSAREGLHAKDGDEADPLAKWMNQT